LLGYILKIIQFWLFIIISCNAVSQYKRAIEHYRIAINLELKAVHPDYTNIAYSYDSISDEPKGGIIGIDPPPPKKNLSV
jgi:hypothetical protein